MKDGKRGGRCGARAAAALALLVAAGGCGVGERVRGFFEDEGRSVVAVRIGERSFLRSDIERFFDSRLSEFRNPDEADRVKSNLLEAFIEDRLLLIEAERHRIEADARALKAMLERIAEGSAGQPGAADPRRDTALVRDLGESLKTQRYLRDHLLRDIAVSGAECENYYQAHIGDFIVNDVVRLREILVDNENAARSISDLLKKSRNRKFAELARAHSRASSAAEGGAIGAFQRGELPEDFEKAVFRLPVGAVSKWVRTRYGLHLFLVEERIAAHQQKLWEVKEKIRERLRLEREREGIDNEIRRLAGQTPVRIERENLGFNYVGTRFTSR